MNPVRSSGVSIWPGADSEGTCRGWHLWRSGPGPAALNMALDEALLEAAAQLGRPVLRLYGWTEPAASFGYFQRYGEVARLTLLRPLVRRPTGGGLVPHEADWTYSLVFPPTDSWYALRAGASYERVHEWVRAALARLGTRVELAAVSRKELPGACFAGAEPFDVVSEGRKIAGAAQRRTRQGLLIQGSIQPPAGLGLTRPAWEEAFCAVAHAEWAVDWRLFEPTPALLERAAALARETYSRPEYNQRR